MTILEGRGGDKGTRGQGGQGDKEDKEDKEEFILYFPIPDYRLPITHSPFGFDSRLNAGNPRTALDSPLPITHYQLPIPDS